MEEPLISVIIPVFNADQFISDCLWSVRKQSYERLEIVCVDDGSVDRSPQILAQHASTEPRMVVISQDNRGVSAARNAGLERATGELVTFVDADDVVDADMLRRLTEAAVTGVDLAMAWPGKHGAWTDPEALREFAWDALRNEYINPPWAKLYRSRIIRLLALKFRTDVSIGEDLLFNIEYLEGVKGVAVIDESLYWNRQSPTSLTRAYRTGKCDELLLVNDRVSEIVLSRYGDSFRSLMSYIRIKNLISCCGSMRHPDSSLSQVDVRRSAKKLEMLNRELRVPHGDPLMRLVGGCYRYLGLYASEQLVHAYKTVRGSLVGSG